MTLTTSTSYIYLLPDVIFFGIVVGLCFHEVLTTQKMIKTGDIGVSTGMEIRKWFHFVLFLGVFGRFVSLSAQLIFFNREIVCPGSVLCLLTRTTPELLFLTLYTVLILFFAQLSNIASGTTFRFMRSLFVLFNVVFYFGYLAAVVFARSHMKVLATTLNFLFGIYYLMVLGFLFYYGPYVTGTIMTGTSSPQGYSRVPKRVVSRFVAVMMLYAVIIIIRCIYFLGNATNFFGWQDGVPPSMDPYLYETVSSAVCELLPACVVLFIMRRRKNRYLVPFSSVAKASSISPSTERSNLIGSGGGEHPFRRLL
mmetsp:Transcript_38798/g.51118  ORF Transcript_38798/g.51118 Transcript_38798/m.51118 type:complete len:310 (-) Transcript_38798:441-1370(-)